MKKLVVTRRDREVQKANREVHDFGADNFEFYPPYMKKKLRRLHREDAQYIRSLFTKRPLLPDCGCGNGWLVEEFSKYGFTIDINDISPKMVEITKEKMGRKVRNATAMDATELLHGLAAKGVKYDVICFSSMLHHIYDYLRVLHYASQCLAPGGVIYIFGEPQEKKRMNAIDKALTFIGGNSINLYKAVRRPVYAARFIRSHYFSKKRTGGNVQLAEFHAGCGLDEKAVHRKLRDENLRVVQYKLYSVPPFFLLEAGELFTRGSPKIFRLVAMKIR